MNIRILVILLLSLLVCHSVEAKGKKGVKKANEVLSKKIEKAIDQGTRNILALQNPNGSFNVVAGNNTLSLEMGGRGTAFCLYTILSSNLPENDQKLAKSITDGVNKGFQYMHSNHRLPGNTYGDGILLLALEKWLIHKKASELKAKRNEKKNIEDKKANKKGVNNKKKAVDNSIDVNKWMNDIVGELMSFKIETQVKTLPIFKRKHGDMARSKRKDAIDRKKKYPLDFTIWSWGYPNEWNTEGKPDISNTQYAVLGLAAAHRSGIKIPKNTFWKILHYGLYTQQEKGKKVKRYAPKNKKGVPKKSDIKKGKLGRYGNVVDKDEVVNYRKKLKSSRSKDTARGWGYCHNSEQTAKDKAYGSMTTAGLACILVGQMGLVGDAKYHDIYETHVHQCVYDGLGWLGHNFNTKTNPLVHDFHGKDKELYYFYGMERVGVMAGVENFGKHLWYSEIAEELVNSQKPDGSWKTAFYHTCFGVLFLSRSTKPVKFRKYKTGVIE